MDAAYLVTFGGFLLAFLGATFPQYSNSQKTNSSNVKVLSYNIYMVPSFFASKMPEFKTAKNQDKRMKGLGELAINHEIVGMQEFWGPASYIFTSYASRSHSLLYKSWFGSFLLPESWNEYIEVYTGMYFQRGGIQIAVKNDIPIVHKDRHIFQNNSEAEKSIGKNVVGYLLDMNTYWPGKYLLFFDVHMNSDPVNVPSPVRSEQLKEMREFMCSFLDSIKEKLGGKSTLDVGFILVGDFNCASTCSQYEEIVNAFGKSRDLFFEQHKDIANTESCFTYDNSSKNSYVINELNGVVFSDPGRIDYIFAIDQFFASNERKIDFMHLESTYSEIIRQPYNEEFSDHWGVEAHIQPKNTN